MVDPGTILSVNGMQAIINTPPALQGEGLHQLPPHKPVQAYVVDEYPACPDTWEHGSDKASSYFVSLQEGNGMWFDFTANQFAQHHIAVVVSVQGINPVTNKPITELCLVQHKKQCPIHGVDFQQDRYCPHKECQYKWPAQNYIATTTGKKLWIDGFMNAVGETRQYIISADEARGIAKQIEDKDPEFKRVWAVGFAFYLSVEQKPPPQPTRSSSFGYSKGGGEVVSALGFHDEPADLEGCDYEQTGTIESFMKTTQPPQDQGKYTHRSLPKDKSSLYKSASLNMVRTMQATRSTTTKKMVEGSKGMSASCQSSSSSVSPGPEPLSPMGGVKPPKRSRKMKSAMPLKRQNTGTQSAAINCSAITPVTPVKKVEVGAGARINQDLGTDPNDIKFWRPEPIGMIYVNLTDPETLKKILDAGRRQDKPEGSLNGLRIGND